MSDPSLQLHEDGRVSFSEALDGMENLLARHARATRRSDDEARIKLLARAQLRKWIVYPHQDDTPSSVAARGRRLLAALHAGDENAVVRAGGFRWVRKSGTKAEKGRSGSD